MAVHRVWALLGRLCIQEEEGDMMAGKIKHILRKKAMVEYGKQYEEFYLRECLYFMNKYRNKHTGKIHRQTQSTPVQLNNLLRSMPQFILIKKDRNGTKWRYIGDDKQLNGTTK